MKYLAHMKMFWQRYLENKKPTFLACIPQQDYAAILESSKNNDQNRQMHTPQILDILLAWFL